MATQWRLHFLGQPYPFRQWLAALAFVYSLATIERAHKVFRRSMNNHVSDLLLFTTGLSTCQETFRPTDSGTTGTSFAPLLYYQLYLPNLLYYVHTSAVARFGTARFEKIIRVNSH